jgi:hypothetical protein
VDAVLEEFAAPGSASRRPLRGRFSEGAANVFLIHHLTVVKYRAPGLASNERSSASLTSVVSVCEPAPAR